MKPEEVLKKCIEIAVENGWKTEFLKEDWKMADGKGFPTVYWGKKDAWMVGGESIIFSHDFCKALFGEKELEWESVEEHGDEYFRCPAWEHHIKELATSEDRIKYLEDYLTSRQ